MMWVMKMMVMLYAPLNWLLFFLIAGIALYVFIKYKVAKATRTARKEIGKGNFRRESAVEILEKRFARGEITEQEFIRLKGKIRK